MSHIKEYLVYFDHLTPMGEPPPLMGVLSVQQARGRELFAFELNKAWLKRASAHLLDPDLFYYEGMQYTSKKNFGLFMDSAPDRWGRKLMQRREALVARQEKRQARVLTETDYLMGVFDETRMGALRFKEASDGSFINNDAEMATPPWARLRELEGAARQIDSDDVSDDLRVQWLNLLLAPGSSLGGARPKANIQAPDGTLWLAKFPKKGDDVDTSAWEYLAWHMAKEVGLAVPEAKMTRYSSVGSTFLVKRFDRKGQQRIHFASAMTLLGKEDGTNNEEGVSYLDLAAFIRQYSAAPKEDLHELWSRMVFSIAISNTDDHLRNHGFLYTPQGWRLSPAYDLNPNPYGNGLSLNISAESNAQDFELALEVASYFQLPLAKANERLTAILSITRQWQTYAHQCKIPRAEQDLFAGAFR